MGQHYDAVIFSSDHQKDLDLARKLENIMRKEIKVLCNKNSNNVNEEIEICTFHDSFHERSHYFDRTSLALKNSTLYFFIITKHYLRNTLNVKSECYAAIWESLTTNGKEDNIIPVYSKFDPKKSQFLDKIKYLKMLTPVYFEEIIDNENFFELKLDDTNNVVMNKYTKKKLTTKFKTTLNARHQREIELLNKIDSKNNDFSDDESNYTLTSIDSSGEKNTDDNCSITSFGEMSLNETIQERNSDSIHTEDDTNANGNSAKLRKSNNIKIKNVPIEMDLMVNTETKLDTSCSSSNTNCNIICDKKDNNRSNIGSDTNSNDNTIPITTTIIPSSPHTIYNGNCDDHENSACRILSETYQDTSGRIDALIKLRDVEREITEEQTNVKEF